MSGATLLGYALLAAVVALYAWRWYGAARVRRQLPELLRAGATLVDVRTPAEYAAGHAGGTLNIPLDQLGERSGELDPERWIVLCCASGTRSAMGVRLLRSRGFPKVVNGGTWRNVRP
jgi:rhodanese-related sulfurtransferase